MSSEKKSSTKKSTLAELNVDWSVLNCESKDLSSLISKYEAKISDLEERTAEELDGFPAIQLLRQHISEPKHMKILAKVLNRIADLQTQLKQLQRRQGALSVLVDEKDWFSRLVDTSGYADDLMSEIENELNTISTANKEEVTDGAEEL